MRNTNISGRLAANAEVKVSKNGSQFLQFRMASQIYGDKEPLWVNVTSWNPGDIKRAQWFTKGKPVNVFGEFSASAYINKNGVAVPSVDIRAYSVEWVEGSRDDQGQNAVNNTATQTATPTTNINDGMTVTAKPTFAANVTPPVTQPSAVEGEEDLPF